jgi:hypothetical protein
MVRGPGIGMLLKWRGRHDILVAARPAQPTEIVPIAQPRRGLTFQLAVHVSRGSAQRVVGGEREPGVPILHHKRRHARQRGDHLADPVLPATRAVQVRQANGDPTNVVSEARKPGVRAPLDVLAQAPADAHVQRPDLHAHDWASDSSVPGSRSKWGLRLPRCEATVRG